LHQREKLISLATDEINGDPMRYGFELPHWDRLRQMLKEKDFIYVAGGKRASKSEFAAKYTMLSALCYPRGKIWCFQDSDTTSLTMQQGLIWKYLPKRLKALNNKRNAVYKITYSQANGFSSHPRNKLILPNRTEIHFLTYGQEPQGS
jgi:hypothetical protein